MKITILVDNLKSWVLPFAGELKEELEQTQHQVRLVHCHGDIEEGDILILLSCEMKLSESHRALNRNNLVVHSSNLPHGKGWSPLNWQVSEGKNEITITLFEADEAIDSGRIYKQEVMKLQGHELIDELRKVQAAHTKNMIVDFIKGSPDVPGGAEQRGKSSYYRKRTVLDSELDAHKTIAEQFNLLRVVDNEDYPAFFKHKGQEYVLKIFKK